MADKSCEELIKEELNERIADFKQALKSYEEKGKVVTEDGDVYEDVIDWINNYALGYYDDKRFRAKRLELSYGGPQDYFLYFPSNGLIEYHYINWGDEAILYLDGMRYNIMLKIFKMLEATGSYWLKMLEATGDGEEGKYEEYDEEYEEYDEEYEEYQPFDEEEFEEFENYDGIEQFDDDFNEEE